MENSRSPLQGTSWTVKLVMRASGGASAGRRRTKLLHYFWRPLNFNGDSGGGIADRTSKLAASRETNRHTGGIPTPCTMPETSILAPDFHGQVRHSSTRQSPSALCALCVVPPASFIHSCKPSPVWHEHFHNLHSRMDLAGIFRRRVDLKRNVGSKSILLSMSRSDLKNIEGYFNGLSSAFGHASRPRPWPPRRDRSWMDKPGLPTFSMNKKIEVFEASSPPSVVRFMRASRVASAAGGDLLYRKMKSFETVGNRFPFLDIASQNGHAVALGGVFPPRGGGGV